MKRLLSALLAVSLLFPTIAEACSLPRNNALFQKRTSDQNASRAMSANSFKPSVVSPWLATAAQATQDTAVLLETAQGNTLKSPYRAETMRFEIDQFLHNYQLVIRAYAQAYSYVIDTTSSEFVIDREAELPSAFQRCNWNGFDFVLSTNGNGAVSKLQIGRMGFEWTQAWQNKEQTYHQLAAIAASLLGDMSPEEAIQTIDRAFRSFTFKESLDPPSQRRIIAYALNVGSGIDMKLVFTYDDGVAAYLVVEYGKNDASQYTGDENVVVDAHAYTIGSNKLTGNAFCASGEVITEVGMYWGEDINSLTLLGNDQTTSIGSNYLDFNYSFSAPPSGAFVYQAYAIVGGERYSSAVMRATMDGTSFENSDNVPWEGELVTTDAAQQPYTYTKEQLETLEYVQDLDHALLFFNISYPIEALDDFDLGTAFHTALGIGHDLLKAVVGDFFSGQDTDSYMVDVYADELMGLIKSLAPDSYSQETSDYPEVITKSLQLYGEINLDHVRSLLPQAEYWSQTTQEAMKTLGDTVNALGILSLAPGAINELAEIASIAFADYEKGAFILDTLDNATQRTGNDEFEAAVAEVHERYSDKMLSYAISFLKEAKNKLVSSAFDLALGALFNAYTAGSLLYEVLTTTAGIKKLGEDRMQFIAQTEVFNYCRSAYYDAFMRVYKGDHSPQAIDELILLYKLTLSSGDRLYISLYQISSSSKRSDVLNHRAQELEPLYNLGPVFFVPDNDE